MIIGNPITLGGGTNVGVSYNADGTQNLTILDKGKIVEEPPVLLWANSNPTSAFSAQTITVPSGYAAFLCEARYSDMFDITCISYLHIGGDVQWVAAVRPEGNQYSGRKVVTTETSLTFRSGESGESNDYIAIPTRIWGVKYAV